MKLFKAAALAGALALSGCVDVDLTTTITGADQASVTGNMTIQRQMLEMMGGTDAFCSADEAMREFGDWRDIGLGLILAAFVILLPRGLAGLATIRKR